jgi:hypothetical protein
MFEHDADLVLPAFSDLHFVPRIRAVLDALQLRRRRPPAMHGDTLAKLLLLRLCQPAGHLHYICLGDVVGGRGQAMRELAVVGQQQQSFAVIIQAAHRKHAFADPAHQVHHGLPTLRVGNRGHAFLGLVERDIGQVFGRVQRASVDLDVIIVYIGLGTQLGDGLPVHRNAAFDD